jgi:Flp pilus assembly protein TadD
LVNDSEKVIAQGREALLSGEVEKALEHFRRATEMDRDNPDAWLNLGVASKLRGDLAGARNALEKAQTLGAQSPTAAEAERILKTLGEDAPRAQPPHPVDSRLDDGRG